MSQGPRVLLRLLPHAKGLEPPAYRSELAAGLDLPAAVEQPLLVEPGGRALVPTGIEIALPFGYEAQVRPRSGLALEHGVTVLNSPGTIDADYRGEIRVLLINLGKLLFTVNRGDRIAQLVIAPCCRAELVPASELPPTPRGSGGFGHTGRS